jgi:CO/xanthine dehydrogenase FAD-binding subunit
VTDWRLVDLSTVTSYRVAHSAADLALAPGETFLAGGTWLFSEPNENVTGLVDLTSLGWDAITESDAGVTVGALVTIEELVRWAKGAEVRWPAARLAPLAADALLASFKVWHMATVGGNVCRAYTAAAMISLGAGLDAVATVVAADGTEYVIPVAEIPTGDTTTTLGRSDALRSIFFPAAALRSRAALRKIALARYGRSGAVATGRVDHDGSAVFTITAATQVPTVWRLPALPAPGELTALAADAPGYYTDPMGSADWRRHVSGVLLEQLREDLA